MRRADDGESEASLRRESIVSHRIASFLALVLSFSLALPVPARNLPHRPVAAPATLPLTVAADDGQPLALWARVPARPRGAILLVHGRTWSSRPNFDLQVPGEPADSRSVLAALAKAGYAAYALDLRGYGATPRDASGWDTPERAAADVVEALRWIGRRHPPLPLPALLGYSNGARVALLVAQEPSAPVSAVVLYGFPNDVDAPEPPQTVPAEPARQCTTAEAAASDFVTAGASTPAVRDAYVAQALAADPVRSDWRGAEQVRFEPEHVRVPVLLMRGVNDPLATQDESAHLYLRLGTGDKTWVTLPASDHVAHVEDSHAAWVRAVVDFLGRPRVPAKP